jgi:hypothetical protein
VPDVARFHLQQVITSGKESHMVAALKQLREQFSSAAGFDLLGAADLVELVQSKPEAREALSKMPMLAGGCPALAVPDISLHPAYLDVWPP